MSNYKAEALVESQFELGRLFHSAEHGSKIRILDAECEEYCYPYTELVLRQLKNKGCEITVIAGPVLLVKEYSKKESDAYIEYYLSHPEENEYRKIGDSFCITREYGHALYAYGRAVQEEPQIIDDMTLQLSLSHIFCEIDEYKKAIEILRNVLKHDRENPCALNNFGYALLKSRKYLSAARVLENAIMSAEDRNDVTDDLLACLYNNLGDAFKAVGDLRAIRCYGMTLVLDPFHVGTIENLAEIGKVVSKVELNTAIKLDSEPKELFVPELKGGIQSLYSDYKKGNITIGQYNTYITRLQEITTHIIKMNKSGRMDDKDFGRLCDYYDIIPRWHSLDL